MSAPEIIDRLNALGEAGVTISAVPFPVVDNIEAIIDHARSVMEEIEPQVA